MEASATERTLGVTELLELVLLELPIRDIFQAQRVSQQWKAVISNSSPLRKAMWLTPVDSSSTQAKHDEVELPTHSRLYSLTDKNHPRVLAAKHFNPLLPLGEDNYRIELMMKGWLSEFVREELVLVVPDPTEWKHSFSLVASKGEDKAAWEDMQVFSPPITRFEIHIVDTKKGTVYVHNMPKLYNENGIRMGEMMKQLYVVLKKLEHVL
ncbi:uncharacterized protein BDZ99DRAFT_518745 [Mytilinidion resinicola]|uniref:F-box domain-containing protein n=1 Tax=Mytilinidion resinicola TaxID=574789 RepID=A0A6A6YTX7_9PEZI|nr:uncharacterized protein BDZ99DRAFT_518745 [Mytilinidion resinicola]KAF2811474.1 hypothetical protein BDZ99DRAFT_518745 [Mytilinidion resinicola]